MNASDVIARLNVALEAPAPAAPSVLTAQVAGRAFASALTDIAKDNGSGRKRDDKEAASAAEKGAAGRDAAVLPVSPIMQLASLPQASGGSLSGRANAPDRAPGGAPTPASPAAMLVETSRRERAAAMMDDPTLSRIVKSSSASANGGASSPVIRIDNIHTFLPVALSHALAEPSHAKHVEHAMRSQPHISAVNAPAVKTLRVLIEPEALGALTIRLRVSNRQVEVEIDASKPAAALLLAGTREKLAEAMSQKGVSLDVENIKISQTQTPAPMTEDRGADRDGEGRGSPPDGRFAHDEGRRRRSQPGEQSRRDDDGGSAPRRIGLLL